MQLLIEEFHNKVSEFLNHMGWSPLKILMKLVFYGSVIFVIWWLFRNSLVILVGLVGFLFLAELAHYIRKLGEKKMTEKETLANIKKEKPKNKGLLVKKKIVKKQIVKKQVKIKEKTKNKGLLNK